MRSWIQIRIKNATPKLKDIKVDNHLSDLPGTYIVVPEDKASIHIVYVCQYHCINYMINELGINNEEIMNNHRLLEYQPKMRDRTIPHCIKYLNYTSFLIHNLLLLDLPGVLRNFFQSSQHQFYQQAKPGLKIIVKTTIYF